MDLSDHEKEARKRGIIEPTKLARGTVILLECDNDLILEMVATNPQLNTYTASANFGSLKQPQDVEIRGAVLPGQGKQILTNMIAKNLRLALRIRGRLKVLPAVMKATLKGAGWSYDLWSD